MQMIWIVPIVTLGFCQFRNVLAQPQAPAAAQPPQQNLQGVAMVPNAQQPGQQAPQGADQQPPEQGLPPQPPVPVQNVPKEPEVPEALVVERLDAIPAPRTDAADAAKGRAYMKAMNVLKIEALMSHLDSKKNLIKHLRSVIGDGFIVASSDMLTRQIDAITVAEKAAFDGALATYTGALNNGNGQAFYAASDALVAALPAAHAAYDKWIKHILLMGYSWGNKSAYEVIRVTLHYTFKMYAENLRKVYTTLSDVVKHLGVPGNGDEHRTKILEAFQSAAAGVTFTKGSFESPHHVAAAYLKYADMLTKNEDALNAANAIVGLLNVAFGGHVPAERALALALTDVKAVLKMTNYMSLLPVRMQGQNLTAEKWLEHAAILRYISSVGMMKMAHHCHSQVMSLAPQVQSFNPATFSNSYNTLVKDALSYNTAAAQHMFDTGNAPHRQAAEAAIVALMAAVERFIIEYKAAMTNIVENMNPADKMNGEINTLKTDAKVLQVTVTYAARFLRFYGTQIAEAADGASNDAYVKVARVVDEQEKLVNYAVSQLQNMAAPEGKEELMATVATLEKVVDAALAGLMEFDNTIRTWYTQPDDPARHSKVITDMRKMLDAMASDIFGGNSGQGRGGMQKNGTKGNGVASSFSVQTTLILGATILLMT
ncbi:uncharacterized protein BXIN_2116 [Babesia sp. Xinjiang]|uniref:uncharacterized protein n=1 Tax=Babesia sp. Xinjiang TaxID=462227 RepID=UPI000A2371C2|nr:uncharacterized protein BXIN_2116 [Babesia sp. Xinjiang]ORM40592.1 hypothetical protein BXIN_2116 [Babesia sp. Xinjiang]